MKLGSLSGKFQQLFRTKWIPAACLGSTAATSTFLASRPQGSKRSDSDPSWKLSHRRLKMKFSSQTRVLICTSKKALWNKADSKPLLLITLRMILQKHEVNYLTNCLLAPLRKNRTKRRMIRRKMKVLWEILSEKLGERDRQLRISRRKLSSWSLIKSSSFTLPIPTSLLVTSMNKIIESNWARFNWLALSALLILRGLSELKRFTTYFLPT